MSANSLFDWPAELDRTPPEQRESTSKFDTNLRKTKRDLEKEMERMGVDEWRLSEEGSGGPAVVLRWIDGGTEYAIGADSFTARKDNLRELYLWVNETRMRSNREVKTGQSDFAAAALPGKTTETTPDEPPHEILEISPGASDTVIEAAARQLKKKYSPDGNDTPDRDMFIKVNKAESAMLGE